MVDVLEPPKPPGYALCERLGAGTYATVYRALSLSPGPSGVKETVAIKCIDKKKHARSKIVNDNIVSEISILKKLRHKHIVQLLDFRWDKRYIYLIMEYCNGGDLSAFIRQQRQLPEIVARKFLRQLASAIKYCRSMNISHMDLKPQNLLLTNRHRPVLKVADFGFAQYLREDIDTSSSYRGSPLYMAPEILNRRHYDASVDLWSIGVILYECLFGKAPYSSSSLEELVAQITADRPIVIPNTISLSPECRNLLEGLLRRQPHLRLSFDEFFACPFVDLASCPSEESLPRAEQLAREAQLADERQHTVAAVKLYVQALDYFLQALQYAEDEDGGRERGRLRERIRHYISRAETLKRQLRPAARQLRRDLEKDEVDSTSVCSTSAAVELALERPDSLTELDTIERLWADTPQVNAALTVVSKAEQLERDDAWEAALNKYSLAIESMLQLLNNEPAGQRKDLLKLRVQRWLARAEQLQSYVEVQRLNLSKMELTEQRVIEADTRTEEVAKLNQCALQ